MAQKDKAEKVLEDYNDVFADIYNTLLFQKSYLEEDRLKPGPTESIYKDEKGEWREQRRDVLKNYMDSSFCICAYAMENQSVADENMPVRVMGYDYASYRDRIINGEKPVPVVTIVLNFSDTKWNKPRSLHEMLDIPKELKPFVQDYGIRVFDIAYLDDGVIDRFQSDFKVVAQFFKNKRLKKEDVMSDNSHAIRHVEAVLELLSVFTRDDRYREIYQGGLKAMVEKGESVYMCNVAQSYIDKGMEQGIELGIEQGIEQGIERGIEQGIERGIERGELVMLQKLVTNGRISIEEAALEMNVTVDRLKELFETL